MKLTAKTKLSELLAQYPSLVDFLAAYSPKYEILRNPLMRNTMGKLATLEQIAQLGELDLGRLTQDLDHEITRLAEAKPGSKQEILRGIILDLHRGVPIEQLKARFAALVREVDASEIASLEQKIIAEGVPEEEVKKLCDLHVEVFKESLEESKGISVEPGHPVHTYIQENEVATTLAKEIRSLLGNRPLPYRELSENLQKLSQLDKHYLRKENQLFPILEAKELSGPTAVMWAIHDDIRTLMKQAQSVLSQEAEPAEVISTLEQLLKTIEDMIYKEEQILFPTSLDVLTENDWARVREGEEDIGFAWVSPGEGWSAQSTGVEPQQVSTPDNTWPLDTGRLSQEQLNLILTNLPIDITFVDETDSVCYYSQGKERIFPRTPAIIGRKVTNCHPPDSVHKVTEIINAFKAGKQDTAQFWIQLHGKFILIRYFAICSDGKYRGVLEVSQDLTELRKLEGERRLLDWDMKDI